MKKPDPWGNYHTHRHWMKEALKLAEIAANLGDVPVGAVIINRQGNILAEGYNSKEVNHDPTGHAEIIAIRQASQTLKSWHLEECTLYVTLEPCIMCAGAIIQSRLGLLVYGVDDLKSGSIRTALNLPDSVASNHHLSVLSGILEAECRQQLKKWFINKRQQKN
ncbi:tRNA adenosine(34) deaminase TadA [Crocosphaera chwakensis]|uniref:tRNA-specific adenosine deaminase n=1 Tax=Crocosphaera chwakensis CCY0110 TaxID=391612 RepID=A3IP58_9CHRO|nr:tRNA adenosine(34) deaminase TadA [Crocosphaera chwakensis]EAZ91623.1 Cytidine/deoxycytidylate deaminase, zinc-binding region [Crocosphaera chwakensis CCY0110]